MSPASLLPMAALVALALPAAPAASTMQVTLCGGGTLDIPLDRAPDPDRKACHAQPCTYRKLPCGQDRDHE